MEPRYMMDARAYTPPTDALAYEWPADRRARETMERRAIVRFWATLFTMIAVPVLGVLYAPEIERLMRWAVGLVVGG